MSTSKKVRQDIAKEREMLEAENQKHMGEMLEQIRQEAFLEGYTYAIELLQESIVNKEKTK